MPVRSAGLKVCPDDHGVSVVVEPGSLGGADQAVCVTEDVDATASELFEDAGWSLTPVSTAPSVVCRIDGLPDDIGCSQMPAADAYWSLWWTDGDGGDWTYSSLNADALTIPEGGRVAFTWVDGSDDGRPETPVSGQGSEGQTATAQESQPVDDSSSLPGWVAPVVIALLLAGVGLAAVLRGRRRS